TQLPFVLQRLARDGVRLTPNVTGVASSGRAVTLRHLFSEADEQRERIAVVVIAGRRMALCALPDQLAAAAPGLPVVVVGDALSPERGIASVRRSVSRVFVSREFVDLRSSFRGMRIGRSHRTKRTAIPVPFRDESSALPALVEPGSLDGRSLVC